MNQNLTEGRIGKSLLTFSLPLICGNLLQQVYNVADTLIVGKTIGPSALAAVGSSYALMVLLTSVILGLCMGSGVVLAQLFGARREDDFRCSIANAFVLILAVSVLINLLAFLLLDKLIVWMRIPPEAAEETREYLRIIFVGITAVFLYNFFAAVLRSVGNTTAALVFLGISAAVNIVLDLVFILFCNMGVAGAAWATVIAQALSAVNMTVYFFWRCRALCPQKRHLRYDRRLLGLLLSNSALTAVQQSIMNFGILMVQGLVNSFGFAASAAFAAVVKIDAFAYMPAQDFGNAFSTFTAQNYGAGKFARIRRGSKTALLMSVIFCIAASACVCGLAKPFMLLFVKPEETEIIRIGVQYLHIEGAFYAGIGILFLLYGFYRGIGRPGMSVVLTVLSLGSRVALAYGLSALPGVGILGVWWAVPIGWGLADLFGVWYYYARDGKILPRSG